MNHDILIVDDEPDLAGMIANMLVDAGYTTRIATGGQEALDEILARPPDLVLTDVNMPGMDGFALVSKLKAYPATATIPVIMLSAQDGRGSRIIGLESGAEHYLSKPVDPAELLSKIHNQLLLHQRTVQGEHP